MRPRHPRCSWCLSPTEGLAVFVDGVAHSVCEICGRNASVTVKRLRGLKESSGTASTSLESAGAVTVTLKGFGS